MVSSGLTFWERIGEGHSGTASAYSTQFTASRGWPHFPRPHLLEDGGPGLREQSSLARPKETELPAGSQEIRVTKVPHLPNGGRHMVPLVPGYHSSHVLVTGAVDPEELRDPN